MSNNVRVLMVDDEPLVLDALGRLIQSRFDVSCAIGGADGLEALRSRGNFGVVITDMNMPEMDGIRFIEEARKIQPDAVYMMLTGCAQQETEEHASACGVFRFILKPCRRAALEQAISDATEEYKLQAARRQAERDAGALI
jgi:DNA-binding NtrC family response regulator